ncbi:hypothetical protein NQ317_000726, partial [Molorchus minor]
SQHLLQHRGYTDQITKTSFRVIDAIWLSLSYLKRMVNCEVVMSRNTTRSNRTEAPKKHD